jgi:hypothetical protein
VTALVDAGEERDQLLAWVRVAGVDVEPVPLAPVATVGHDVAFGVEMHGDVRVAVSAFDDEPAVLASQGGERLPVLGAANLDEDVHFHSPSIGLLRS